MRNARRRTISPIGPHPKMENPVVTQSLANAASRWEASRFKIAYVGTAIALVLAAAGAGQAVAQPKAVDVIVRGGTVYTGAEQAPFVGDVAFDQDKIVYVGPASGDHFTAKRTIDAKGMIVAPGLIDAHTHPDFYIRSADPALRVNAPWLAQGVSTVFIGVDGYGTPDVKADQDKLEQDKIGTNVVSYVGFGAIRNRILQQDARAPSPAELDQMKALVAKGMCEGAIGFSTGLFYAPQSFAKTEEVIALAKEAAKRGGVYDTHQRDESNYTIGVLNSVKEVIRIGREAGMPVHIAHLKALGVDVQGQGQAIVDLINQARASGLDATADEYPWLASGSSLQASLVPGWAVDGGYPAMIKRFDDPATMEKIRVEMRENLRRRGGADSMLLTAYDVPWSGKTLTAMAAEWKVEPIEAAVRILRQARNKGSIASFNMADRDVDLIMKQPWVVTSSDGSDGH
ncbi:MAG: amidohydrolase, partial [Caulobacteraceae bacterium]|nr:amidohydrolase [Caulobacteraceae bacterium]